MLLPQGHGHVGEYGLRESCVGSYIRLAPLHEDVDVVAGLCEVNEVDNVGVLYLLPNDHFRLDAFDDVHFQLLPGLLVPLFLSYLCKKDLLVCPATVSRLFCRPIPESCCRGARQHRPDCRNHLQVFD